MSLLGKIQFLKLCSQNFVIPGNISRRVSRVKCRNIFNVERAFLRDEIIYFSEALSSIKTHYVSIWGLAVPIVGVNAFATASKIVDKVLTVNENCIALSILRLVEQEKAVVEGAGAVGLAAILQNLCPELLGKKVVVALCGGNIDTPALGRVLERGLAADGRLIKFVTTISDRPGGLAELTRLISSIGISIKDIFHERAWLTSNVFAVRVKIIAESKGHEHTNSLKDLLSLYYEDINWSQAVCLPSCPTFFLFVSVSSFCLCSCPVFSFMKTIFRKLNADLLTI
ncbi:E4.3.1.19 [Acanthosepion pharaonis]|uniref:E4.3.1.19 n=1 Tax=Acanthosepion pharaonis TaxID=158019 RepID=A0A812E6E8_ACAPH|nr:E4.3.1.19 [Sepia pharaonis]